MDDSGGAALNKERGGSRSETPDFEATIHDPENAESGPQRDISPPLKVPGDNDGIIAGIPAYNEEVTIGSVVVEASRYVDEVVVVDDGSTDATSEIAAQAGATVVKREENGGKGAAIRTLAQFLRIRDFRAVVLLDGDGQHIPRDIPQVVEPVLNGEADLVIGSRYVNGDSRKETPIYRRFGQRFLDTATSKSSGVKVGDSQSGFRALSAETFIAMSTSSDGYSIETEMLFDASRNGLRITEEPIEVRYKNVDGQTMNPVRHGFEVVGYVNGLLRRRHPLLYFATPGTVLLLGGVGFIGSAMAGVGDASSSQIVIGSWIATLGSVFLAIGFVLHVMLDEFRHLLNSDDE